MSQRKPAFTVTDKARLMSEALDILLSADFQNVIADRRHLKENERLPVGKTRQARPRQARLKEPSGG
jgi:hypothetical protein